MPPSVIPFAHIARRSGHAEKIVTVQYPICPSVRMAGPRISLSSEPQNKMVAG
jgi:hypothetical protein